MDQNSDEIDESTSPFESYFKRFSELSRTLLGPAIFDPEDVYHYTDLSALIGIVTRQQVWATHIDYLNDSTEFEHGRCLALAEIERRSNVANSLAEKLLWEGLSRAVAQKRFEAAFVFCTTRARDSLNLWRGYSTRGASVAIRFKRLFESPFNRPGRKDIKLPFSMYQLPVFYDESDKARIISDWLDFSAAEFRKVPEPWTQSELINSLLAKAALEMHTISYFFKSIDYRDEAEWRVICLEWHEQRNFSVQFRIRDDHIIPYVPIVPNPALKIFAISEILVGPHPDFPRLKMAIEEMLWESGYTPQQVQVSQTTTSLRR